MLHPRQKRRPDVKTDLGIIINDLMDAAISAKNAGRAISRVTFSRDPLIPVVIRQSGFLQLNFFKPGILARRLIKMTVDTNKSIQGQPAFFEKYLILYVGADIVSARNIPGRHPLRGLRKVGPYYQEIIHV